MSEKRAELLLACVIVARSTSFVFNKLGLSTMSAFNLLAVRFLLAFVLLAVLFHKKLRHLSRRTHHGEDGLILGILQVGFLGTYALIASLLFEAPRLPHTGSEWGIVLALALICTGFGYTLQPVAQSHTSAQRASLFCALSPAFATVFGAVLLKEQITLLGGIGILLILGSILLPHLLTHLSGQKCAMPQKNSKCI